MKRITSQIVVAIVCALLGFLLAHQFKLLNNKNQLILNKQNMDIVSEIDNLKKEKEELVKTNASLSEELKKLEDAAAKVGDVEGEIKKSLDNARMNLGLVDVKGPGIIITITANTNIFGSNSVDTSRRIKDDEIVHIVNALKFAKAEAISVNDFRITPQTGIKNSGDNIWVGTAGRIDTQEKITIKAIGDKDALNVAAGFYGTLSYGALRNYKCNIEISDEIIISKTTQTPKTEYIKPVNQ